MPFAPGQSGNPAGYHGTRRWRHKEIFDEIKKLGHRDALITLSQIQHETQDVSLKIAAAAALAPYAHPKLQSIPTPKFVEHPIDVPDFTSVEIARELIATVTVRVARGELDFQSGQELIAMAKVWLDTMNDQSSLDLKEMDHGAQPERTIRIEGGLPQLPGCESLIMPQLNGQEVDARSVLIVNLIRWRARTNRAMLSPDVSRLQSNLVAADRAVPVKGDT
jgi:hypothetical protein